MPINRFQNIIEKCILGLTFAVIACHCLLATFQYVIPYRQFTSYEQWAAVALLVISFFYLTASLLISKASRARVLNFLKRTLNYEQILLLLIFLCFLLSCYVNGKGLRDPLAYFGVHDWFIYDAFICFFLLYPMAKAVGAEKAKKAIGILIHLVVITYSVFTIVSLWHIFQLETITFPSGEEGGMTGEYALMLGKHYNLTGMIAATMFCLCVYMAFARDHFTRILYTFFGIVQLVVVYLCNSRTVFVGVLVFAVFAAFSLTWYFFYNRILFQRLFFSFSIAVVVGIMVWVGRDIMFAIFESITHFSEEIAAQNAGGLSSIVSSSYPATLSSSTTNYQLPTTHYTLLASSAGEAARQLSDLSNRANIWTSALRVMVSSPLAFFLGVTPYGVTGALQESGGYWSEAAHAHNSVLQIGVSIGVPAMALYILFLFSVAANCLRLVFAGPVTKDRQQVVIPAVILCFTAINMAEAYLFAYFSVMAYFFYLFCGYTVLIDDRCPPLESQKIRRWIVRLLIAILVIALSGLVGHYYSNLNNQTDVNLLFGTNHGTFNYHLVQKGFDAKIRRADDGVRVIMNSHDDNGWCVLLFDDGRVRKILSGPFGDAYTISFDAKSNIPNADIRVASRQGDGSESQIDFGTVKISSSNEWEHVTLTGILRGVKATSQGLYFNLKNNPAGTEIFIRNLKLEKRNIARDPENILYGTNLGKTNYSILDYGFNAKLEEDGVGVKVTLTTHDDSGWAILFFRDNNSANVLSGPKGVTYKLSFDVKANVEDVIIRASHKQSNAQNSQIDFGSTCVSNKDVWQTITLTGSLNGVPPSTQGVYLDLRDNPAGTVISIRNLSLKEAQN